MRHLLEALPEQFNFYHLGRVEQAAENHFAEPSDQQGVLFSFHGEERGAVLILFDSGLDASVYSEMGNIIASQLATRLHRERGLDVMISPPRPLTGAQIATLLASARDHTRRDYFHIDRDHVVRVQAVILPAPSEGAAYA